MISFVWGGVKQARVASSSFGVNGDHSSKIMVSFVWGGMKYDEWLTFVWSLWST